MFFDNSEVISGRVRQDFVLEIKVFLFFRRSVAPAWGGIPRLTALGDDSRVAVLARVPAESGLRRGLTGNESGVIRPCR